MSRTLEHGWERGHRDNGVLDTENQSINEGNFRALLKYRIDGGDLQLAEHLKNAKRNATCISGKFQNTIIGAIGKIIRRKIVADVKSSKFYSVLADETRDAAKLDQMTLCLRYVGTENDMKVVKEKFLEFCDVDDETGAGLARAIMRGLEDGGLDIRHIRGQGYDGCNAMSGINKGVQAEIKTVVPQALFFHCASHCFNLVLAHSTEIKNIELAVAVVKSVCSFFSASPKRIRALQEQIERDAPESSIRRLKVLCTTRWVESHRAFITFRELLVPIAHCLEELEQQAGDTALKAHLQLGAMRRVEFVTSLFVVESVSALFLPLSINLQSISLDIFAALDAVDIVLNVLKQKRRNADVEFRDLFEEIAVVCEDLDIRIRQPRICERQAHRDNTPAQTAEDYFRITVYIPYVDSLITQFDLLFADCRKEVVKIQSLIPVHVATSSFSDVKALVEFYSTDLNCSQSELKGEYERWRAMWIEKPPQELPRTAIDALNQCPPHDFTKISTLLQIFATLPVTTSSAERSFSELKLLKSYLRTAMGEKRLNGLASMNIQRDISVTPEEVIELLALDPRKLDLVL